MNIKEKIKLWFMRIGLIILLITPPSLLIYVISHIYISLETPGKKVIIATLVLIWAIYRRKKEKYRVYKILINKIINLWVYI